MIRRGTYFLILEMPDSRISIGSLGTVEIKEGFYCYAGSAKNGLDQRISRHLRKKKKIRWHIDHLTVECSNIEAYECTDPNIRECDICDIVQRSGGSRSIEGFGCSDCKCFTHLFFLTPEAKENLLTHPYFHPYCQQSAYP